MANSTNKIYKQHSNFTSLDGLIGAQAQAKMTNLENNFFSTGAQSSIAYKMNDYRYGPIFDLIKEGTPKKDGDSVAYDYVGGEGMRSLFNAHAGVYLGNALRASINAPLLDSPKSRQQFREATACTIADLVRESENGNMGRAIYRYSDFAYCRQLGKVPNNYLITLRRFPTPCGDHISYHTHPRAKGWDKKNNEHLPDIGRMVTWLGVSGNEINNILKFNVKLNYKEVEAKIEDLRHGTTGGMMSKIFSAADPQYHKQMLQGRDNGELSAGMGALLGRTFPGSKSLTNTSNATPPYASLNGMRSNNKTYGPLDVIKSMFIRDNGITFEQSISLCFEYEWKAYDGINGKSAMLDLLANILATCYTTGTFWGGTRRWVGASQNSLFENLDIFKFADKGDFTFPGFMNSVNSSFQQIMNKFTKDYKLKGDVSDLNWNTMKEVGGKLLNGFAGMALGQALNTFGRPDRQFIEALLTDRATGPWHLTVGNPRNPIIEVGNLKMDSCSIEHFGPLGIDDFPTGLRVNCTLTHAKPRDIVGIEHMYTRGDARIYSPASKTLLDNMYGTTKSTYNKNNNFKSWTQLSRSEQLEFISKHSELQEIIKTINETDIDKKASLTEEIYEAKYNEAMMGSIEDTIDDKNNEMMAYFGVEKPKFALYASAESVFGANAPIDVPDSNATDAEKMVGEVPVINPEDPIMAEVLKTNNA